MRQNENTQKEQEEPWEPVTDGYFQALSDTDFRAMLVFVAVVELQGIRQAARALNCSEPSVSMALSRFRERCSHPLFTREGRKLQPTAEAVTLARELGTCFYLMNRTRERTGVWLAADNGTPLTE